MADLPVLSSGSNFRTPLEKAGKWGVGVAALALIVTLGNLVFPYVISFLTGAIEAGYKSLVLMGVLSLVVATGTVLMNEDFRTSVWYLLMGMIDSFALTVVRIAPEKRVRSYIKHDLRPKGPKVQKFRDKAEGRRKAAADRLEETQGQYTAAMRRAQFLLDHGSSDGGKTWTDPKMRVEFSTVNTKIRSLKPAIERLQKRLRFQEGCVKVLDQLLVIVNNCIEVVEFNLNMMIEENESAGEMVEGGREMRGALGASSKAEFAKLAAQQIQDQTNQWMGEVDGVMQAIQGRIDEGKIDDAIAEEDLLLELNQRVGDMSAFSEKQRQLTEGGEAVLIRDVRSRIVDAIPVEDKRGNLKSSPDAPSSRFDRLLPK